MKPTNKYFVAHVFDRECMDDLRSAIEAAFQETEFVPYYAEQQLIDGHILADKIFPAIQSSLFGLFEISNQNKPNSFIELGYAKGKGKKCILLIKKGIEPPSDLAGFDRIIYSSYKDLTDSLKRYLPSILNGVPRANSTEATAITVCKECKHFCNIDLDSPRADIWYNHLCKASPLPKGIDPTDGKSKSVSTNSFGTLYFSDDVYHKCRDINDGSCRLYEKK
jgi:hypothetical protein